MGKRLTDEYNCPLITMDPTVVDEFEDVARITGVKGVYRRSILQALNLRANARKYAEENNIKAYISLEERMACGVGACLGCVCKTVKKDDHSHVNNTRICTEGPVFDATEVDI